VLRNILTFDGRTFSGPSTMDGNQPDQQNHGDAGAGAAACPATMDRIFARSDGGGSSNSNSSATLDPPFS
jgi:hypothetical protein